MINPSIPRENEELKPNILVAGVGGAGCNAVKNMIDAALSGVHFVACNTDAQALQISPATRKIQLGPSITRGLGAGARTDVGRAAAEESIEQIMEAIKGANMVFITAGMGGGTGTGAAPVIARAAREQGILTVGVVTKPFHFEGSHRMRQAEAGIEALQEYVDTLIVIPNQNLFRIANENTTFADAFNMADQVLHSGVRGVTDLMVMPGLINLDFNDIRAVMSEMGKAMMGTGEAEGSRRAIDAAEAAISNPLLDDVSMKGARGVLINITGGMDMTLFEVDEAANRIRDEVDPDANIIFGSTFDQQMHGRMRVSVVATGIDIESMRKSAGQGTQRLQAAAASHHGHAPAALPAPAQQGFGSPPRNNVFMGNGAAPTPAAPVKQNAGSVSAATFQAPLRAQPSPFAAPANNSQPQTSTAPAATGLQATSSIGSTNVVGINPTRPYDSAAFRAINQPHMPAGGMSAMPVYATQGSAALQMEISPQEAEWGFVETQEETIPGLAEEAQQSPWQQEDAASQAVSLKVAPLIVQPTVGAEKAVRQGEQSREDLFEFNDQEPAAVRKVEAKKRGPSLFERVTSFGQRSAPVASSQPAPQRSTDTQARQAPTKREVAPPASAMFAPSGVPIASEVPVSRNAVDHNSEMPQPRVQPSQTGMARLSASDEDLLEIPAFLRRQAN